MKGGAAFYGKTCTGIYLYALHVLRPGFRSLFYFTISSLCVPVWDMGSTARAMGAELHPSVRAQLHPHPHNTGEGNGKRWIEKDASDLDGRGEEEGFIPHGQSACVGYLAFSHLFICFFYLGCLSSEGQASLLVTSIFLITLSIYFHIITVSTSLTFIFLMRVALSGK